MQHVITQHALAHSIKQTTARVTLRDGQVEVRIHTNVKAWAIKSQDNQAWLLGEIDNILPKNATNKETVDFLKSQITKSTYIEIMGEKLSLQLAEFPAVISDSHDSNTDIILTTQHKHSHVNSITMQFPKSLGSVYTTVVKPQYRIIPVGEKNTIQFKN